jgi:hypothetical protein
MQAPNIVRNHSRQKAAVGLHVTVICHYKKTTQCKQIFPKYYLISNQFLDISGQKRLWKFLAIRITKMCVATF